MTRRLRSARGDTGSIAPLVPFLALALLLLGGLVVDASRQLNARGRAVAYAEEAARAGASAVRPGALVLDERLAQERVRDYCEGLRADDAQRPGLQECAFQEVEAVGGQDRRRVVVRVRVELDIAASLLGIVGVDRLSASAEARARPFEGVGPGDVDAEQPPTVYVPPVPDPDGDGVRVPVTPPSTTPPLTTTDPCDQDDDDVADDPAPPACPATTGGTT